MNNKGHYLWRHGLLFSVKLRQRVRPIMAQCTDNCWGNRPIVDCMDGGNTVSTLNQSINKQINGRNGRRDTQWPPLDRYWWNIQRRFPSGSKVRSNSVATATKSIQWPLQFGSNRFLWRWGSLKTTTFHQKQNKREKNRPRFDASSENPVEFEDTWAAIGRFAAETFAQLFKRAENPVEIGFYSVVHRNWSKLNSFVQHFHKNPTNPSGNLLKMVSTGQKV